MKILILTIFFISFLFFSKGTCYAQPPNYFGSNQEWKYDRYNVNEHGVYNDGVYYVSRDTSINGKSYYIISSRGIISGGTTSPWGIDPPWSSNYFRELEFIVRQSNDSVYRYWGGAGEELMIHYNWQVGDTLKHFGGNPPSYYNLCGTGCEVISIDSINLLGEEHRVFYIDTVLGQQMYMIEGIGNFTEVGKSNWIDEWYFGAALNGVQSLTCYSKDSISIWSYDGLLSTCDFMRTLTVSEIDLNDQLISYPNPVKERFTVDLNASYKHIGYRILDASGRDVLKGSFKNRDRIELSLEQPSGIYFLKIIADDHIGLIRLIKQ